MMTERRIQRSKVPAIAARLYLESAARRADYAALTVADEDGLVVVDAPGTINSEAVAAVAPLTHEQIPDLDGLLDMVTRGETLRVRPFTLDGAAMYLAAVGGDTEPSNDTIDAMQRILASDLTPC